MKEEGWYSTSMLWKYKEGLDRCCINGQEDDTEDNAENNKEDNAGLSQLCSYSMMIPWQHKGFSYMGQEVAQLVFSQWTGVGQVWLLVT